MILDLESTTVNDFLTEAGLWSVSSAVCSSCAKTYTIPPNSCGFVQDVLYGGPNVMGPSGSSAENQYYQRQYSNVVISGDFVALRVSARIFTTDLLPSETPNNALNARINGNFFYNNYSYTWKLCNIIYTDNQGVTFNYLYRYEIRGFFQVPNANTLDLRFVNKFSVPSATASFGLRNVMIYTGNLNGYLSSSSVASSIAIIKNFPCLNNYYWDGTQCSPCHTYCKVCSGSSNNECSVCRSTYYNYNNGTCLAACTSPFVLVVVADEDEDENYCNKKCPTTFYWFHNQSCTSTCPSPLLYSVDANSLKICSNPCYYDSKNQNYINTYLYPDQACIATCNSPLVIKVPYICTHPCSNTNYWTFTNGSCTSQCSSPLVGSTVNAIKYCNSPCPNQYIYPNGSCYPECSDLLVKRDESDIKFCKNPCASANNFLYTDGSCLTTCPSPLLTRSEAGVKYCWNPCASASNFLYPDSSCSSTCDFPLSKKEEGANKFCFSPCSTGSKYLYPNGSCWDVCNFPLSSREESVAKFCFSPCSSDDDYLYLNGTCSDKCDFPLSNREESVAKFCFSPCASSDDFLFPNGTCNDTCDFPLSEREESAAKFCFSPCSKGSEYLYSNGSCSDTCSFPLSNREESIAKLCFNPCPSSDDFLFPDGSCSNECASSLLLRTESIAKYCMSPCSDENDYLYPNGSCTSECLLLLDASIDAGINYCSSPCSGQFIFSNKSCSTDCVKPLIKIEESDIKFCVNPCPEDVFLYTDGSCLPICPAPLLSRSKPDVKYCWNPCEATPLFLYPNSSCLDTCNSPLISKTVAAVKSCFSSCSEYLYPDGSCSSQCLSPLVEKAEPVATYCFPPCNSPNLYHYENGSCLASCHTPYMKSQLNGVNQCLPPCNNSQEYFFEEKQICKQTCPSLYQSRIIDTIRVCVEELSPEEVKKIQDTVSSMETQAQITATTMKAVSSLLSNNPALALLAGQASMLFYIRYISVNYPQKLKFIFQLQDATPFSFTLSIDIPEALEDKIRNGKLPEVFEEYDVYSDFLYNSWDTLTSLVLTLLLILMLSVLKAFTTKNTKGGRIFARILSSLKWNVPLMVICGGFGDIYFYASLQLQATSFETSVQILSFILSVVMIFVGAGIITLGFKIIHDLFQSQNRSNSEERWKNFDLLFDSCERTPMLSFAYISLFLSRCIIFNLIIANLYNYPLLQAILIMIVSLVMFAYLIMKRPLKNLMELVQLFLNEFLVIIVHICVLILAIMDDDDIKGQDLRDGLGETIIQIFFLFIVSSLTFMVIQQLILAYSVYQFLRRLKQKGTLTPTGILNALVNKEDQEINLDMKKEGDHRILEHSNRRIMKVKRNFNQRADSNRIVPLKQHQALQDNYLGEKMDTFPENQESNRSFNETAELSRFLDSGVLQKQSQSQLFDSIMIPEVPKFKRSRRIFPKPPTIQNNSLSWTNQFILESNNDNTFMETSGPEKTLSQDSEISDLVSTISQYRKRRNYLRKNKAMKESMNKNKEI